MPDFINKITGGGSRAKTRIAFALIILLFAASFLIDAGNYYNRGLDWASSKIGFGLSRIRTKEIPFRLGLDLRGGTHLVYDADVSGIGESDWDAAVEGVRDVIERRVNVFGVSEPIVQTNKNSDGAYRIIVELAGVKDIDEAIKMIGETPILEFKEQTEKTGLTPDEKSQIDAFNNEALAKAEAIFGKLISGGNFSELAKEYSEDEKTKEKGGDLGWITATDNPDVAGIAEKLKAGDFNQDLVKTDQGYEIVKLEDKRLKSDPFDSNKIDKEVRAAHILICYEGAQGCESGLTKEQAYEKIKDLRSRATSANFKQLAKVYSTDSGSKSNGGELGWFGRNAMVKPFEDTVFDNQQVGTISYIVETMYGYHLIYKEEEREVTEYKASHILIRTVSEQDILNQYSDWKNTELTGKNLKKSIVEFNPNDNSPEVALEFDDEGSKSFEEITARNVGRQVAIFLDGYPISTPRVNEKITGGKAVITGSFDIKEAKLLAQRLNAGALPVPIALNSQQIVGASLGHESVVDSLKAAVFGIILVVLFMILVYRLPGLLAVVSLMIYGLVALAIFKIWPVTLTLSGIAGFILSLGMAVDANILIFERLKEELRDGKPLSAALEEAFIRAWPSIRDGNISTLITCFILMQFSTSVVKGFALTLSLGILISMFSAIVITRNFLNLVFGEWLEKRKWLLGAKK